MSDLILNGVDDIDLAGINDEIIELKKKIQLSGIYYYYYNT